MKVRETLVFAAVAFASTATMAGWDPVAHEALRLRGSISASAFDRTMANLRGVFERYVPQLDSSSELVSPLQVGGTADRPVVRLSVRKCVFIICKTVDLNAEVSVRESRGGCDRNFLLDADLKRSSDTLAEVYDNLRVWGCLKKLPSSDFVLDLTARAHQAPSYGTGAQQGEILRFLALQTHPLIRALKENLEAESNP